MSGLRTEPGSFEERFAAEEDPWGFASSPYEQAKYADTLAALGEDRTFADGLELGCAIGVLTAQLAPRCAHVDALDASPTALAGAAERTAGLAVALHEAVLPEGLDAIAGGPWDLVVASEVLYYLGPELLAGLLDRVEARTAPGAALVAVHWTGEAASHPQSADEVHAALLARPALRHVRGARREGYRLDVLERR